MSKLAILYPECHYHVFNRTNNREELFRNDENRKYFLRRYQIFLHGFVDTFSYSLLPNHFHFSVRIKSIENLLLHLDSQPKLKLTKHQIKFLEHKNKHEACHYLLASQFSRLFASYSHSFNKVFKRHGNLFNRPFKRIRIESVQHLAYLQYYIHHNARKHGIVKNFLDHKWNSYQVLISNKETFLDRQSIFDFYGNQEAFIKFHQDQHASELFDEITIED